MTRVHVWGASGYAAAEAIRILLKHPQVELGALESASHAGQKLADHFPLLRGSDRAFEGPGAVASALRAGDAVIMGGAHGSAKEQAPAFVSAGARVIDLSADFRFDDSAVYGFPERYREAIVGAKLVANPGCYPTASLLAMLPLASFGTPLQIVVDAKSGITGAGRNPSVGALFAEVYGDVRPYGLSGHRHQPEIDRELRAVGVDAPLVFTPHVVPISRGMLADCYLVYERELDGAAVAAAFADAYAGRAMVRVVSGAPSVAGVVDTNLAEVSVGVVGKTVRAICAIDNLGKGAAGQAVQNFNLMYGYPEESGLYA